MAQDQDTEEQQSVQDKIKAIVTYAPENELADLLENVVIDTWCDGCKCSKRQRVTESIHFLYPLGVTGEDPQEIIEGLESYGLILPESTHA